MVGCRGEGAAPPPAMGSRVLDEPSAEALATISSSNHVGRRDFTPIALFESVTLMYSRRRLWYIGGTIHAGIKTLI